MLRAMKLSEKVAWVTGASSGIGEALVPVLLARGARVVVSARRGDKLDALVQAHGAARVAAVPVDLNELASLDDAVRRAEAAFGRVDALINNAGRSQRAAALDTSMDDVRSLMDLNFMAPVALTRLAAPGMITRGRGVIVIVGSLAGYIATPLRSTYNASKFAVRGWFDALRAELHGTGVSVTLFLHGYAATEITRVDKDGNFHEDWDDRANRFTWKAEDAARVMLSALWRRKLEYTFTAVGRLGGFLGRHAPGLLHFALTRGKSPT